MKKNIKTIIAMGICVLTLGTSTMIMASNLSGYENLKNGIHNFRNLEKNATFDAEVTISVDGKEERKIDSEIKVEDKDSISMKSTFTNDADVFDVEASYQDGLLVTKKSTDETYYTRAVDEHDREDGRRDHRRFDGNSKFGEMFVDLILGDVKNQFVQNGNTISVNLSEQQIPEIVQLFATEASTNHRGSFNFESENAMMYEDLPELVEGTTIKNIQADFVLDHNLITNINFVISVYGKDSAGVAHTVDIDMEISLTNLGETTADALDLTGKVTEEMDSSRIGFGSWR